LSRDEESLLRADLQRKMVGRDRTDDPLLAKQVLSQLSYSPLGSAFMRMKIENPDR
jgi:hypothetical protein